MENTTLGKVSLIKQAGIALISFEHPAGNSLPGRLLKDLVTSIQDAGNDPAIKIIILKSEGKRAFCGGASFDEFTKINDLASGKAFFMGFANVINAIRKCPKLVIARVQGKAVGGGVGLAAAADYCMATKYASIKLSELTIGIGPFVIGPAMKRKIGLSAFSHLGINAAEWQTAEWGKSKGLFNEVFESIEQLDDYLTHFSNQLMTYHPEAMYQLKSVLWEGTDHWDELLERNAEISGKLVLSAYTKMAIERFKQKK